MHNTSSPRAHFLILNLLRSHMPPSTRRNPPQLILPHPPRLGHMPHQPHLTILMPRMALANNQERIPHQELIVRRRKERRGHVDQDPDGRVVHVRKDVTAPKHGGDDARAQVAGEVRGNGYVGEAPDHVAVGKADEKGCGSGGDEGLVLK